MDTYLVEKVGNGLRQSSVTPSAVYQHKSRQETELSNGIICTHDSLTSLFTSNTDTNMRLLNHGNIVGTITDR